MEFYFKLVGATTYLYKEDGFFDINLGELKESFGGKLKTTHWFSENYELEDISGLFSEGQKYSIKSTKGLKGIIEKKTFSDRYVFKEE